MDVHVLIVQNYCYSLDAWWRGVSKVRASWIAGPVFKAYTTWSLSHKVRSCSAVHAAVGFVLQISFVALGLALLGDISSHNYNFCQLKLSFAYITKIGVNMHSHSC